MDKFQVTERINEVRRIFDDPQADIFDVPFEIYEEIKNPPRDKDGYVHKYYLTDEIKGLIEALTGWK